MKRIFASLLTALAIGISVGPAPGPPTTPQRPRRRAAGAAAEAAAAAAAAPAPAAAAAEARRRARHRRPVPNKGDNAWLMVATAFVILMTIPGLALFYGGLVRSKNMLSVLMQVFVIFSLISVLWAVYGYSVAFTEGNAFFGSLDKLFLKGITPDSWPPPSARAS
jgi:Amt family ammonium transporter